MEILKKHRINKCLIKGSIFSAVLFGIPTLVSAQAEITYSIVSQGGTATQATTDAVGLTPKFTAVGDGSTATPTPTPSNPTLSVTNIYNDVVTASERVVANNS